MYGLHVTQCFIDALVTEEIDRGNTHAGSLLDIITCGIDEGDDMSIDADVESFNKLLVRVLLGGSLVHPDRLSFVLSMIESDTRIVWTNDRSVDGKLC